VQYIRLAIKKHNRTVSIPTNVQDRLHRYYRTIIQSQQKQGRQVSLSEVAAQSQVLIDEVHDTLMAGLPIASLHQSRTADSENNELPIDQVDSDWQTPVSETEKGEDRAIIKDVLSNLTHREAMILKMRYGIDMGQEYGYREIADQLNLSRERVRQIELEVIRRIALNDDRLEQLAQ
jgi:RNA polymerase sigma factor (sigma-70 family)